MATELTEAKGRMSPGGTGRHQPEQSLAVAVLHLAIHDATITVAGYNRDRAVLFLTSNTYRWRESRHMWCDVAGLDPTAFEQGALRAIRKAEDDHGKRASSQVDTGADLALARAA